MIIAARSLVNLIPGKGKLNQRYAVAQLEIAVTSVTRLADVG